METAGKGCDWCNGLEKYECHFDGTKRGRRRGMKGRSRKRGKIDGDDWYLFATVMLFDSKTEMGAALWSKTTKNTDCSTGPLAHPFVRLLRTARFALALRCAHSFACSLTSLTPSLVGQWLIRWLFCLCFFLFSTIVCWSHGNSSKIGMGAPIHAHARVYARFYVHAHAHAYAHAHTFTHTHPHVGRRVHSIHIMAWQNVDFIG